MSEQVLFTITDVPPQRTPSQRATIFYPLLWLFLPLMVVVAGLFRLVDFLEWLSREWGREVLVLQLIGMLLILVAAAWIIPATGARP